MLEWLPLTILLVVWLGGSFAYATYETTLHRRRPELGPAGKDPYGIGATPAQVAIRRRRRGRSRADVRLDSAGMPEREWGSSG
jgi:hypothetical protein